MARLQLALAFPLWLLLLGASAIRDAKRGASSGRDLFAGIPDALPDPGGRRTLSQMDMTSMSLPNIVVVTTGGTIASVKDANGELIPAANGSALLAAVPGLEQIANISDIVAAANIDSSDATPEFWVMVARTVRSQLLLASVDGVVLLHGTDTMEQTAWFLQCIDGIGNNREKPVVITGAMRGASSPFADGPSNIYAAFLVATSPTSVGQGVQIVIAQEVFSARYFTKNHANNPNAFAANNGGSKIADVIDTGVVQYYSLNGTALCPAYPLPAKLKSVALQPSYPGVDGSVVPFYQSLGITGMVIEGVGSGNIGAPLGKALVTALTNMTANFSVVVARKPANGITETSYGCEGCLGNLTSLGVVQAFNLDAFQARIVLMLALTHEPNITSAELQGLYNDITYLPMRM